MSRYNKQPRENSTLNSIYFVIFFVVFSSCAIFLRDFRLDKILISNNLSEFNNHIICNEFPQCFRIGTNVIGSGFNYLSMLFQHLIPDQLYGYVTQEEILKIIQDYFSIVIRLLSLAPIFYLVYKKTLHNLMSVFLAPLGISLIVSGWPLSSINSYYSVYLINYDYGAIFLIGLYLLNYEAIANRPKYFYLFLIISSLTFENLPLAFLISNLILCIKSKKYESKRDLLTPQLIGLLIFLAIPLITLFIAYVKFGRIKWADQKSYMLGNIEVSIKLVPVLLLIFLFPYLLGRLLKNTNLVRSINHVNDLMLEKTLFFGLLITYGIGFFNSGISSEGARQTIGAQLIAFLIGISKAKNT